MPNILILGGRAPTALDHARRFCAQGWRVFIADSIPCRIAGYSNAVKRSFIIAPPRFAPAQFVADLNRIIAAENIDLVLPTCEEAFYLARYRAQLPASVQVFVDDFDKLRALHSKWDFLQLAADCGVHVPRSFKVRNMAQARATAGKMPLVLKPEYSRFGVYVRIYPEGIPDHASELPAQGHPDADWIAQQFQPGVEYCSYSICHRGRLLAHAAYRPSYRLHGSSSFYFEPYQSSAIQSFVATFAAKIHYTGQISFDWISAPDGSFSVLECNPRAISGLHLFTATDALPDAITGAITGDENHCILPGDNSPGMLAPVMLSAGLAQALRAGQLPRWWRDFRRARDAISTPGDRLAIAGGLLDVLSYSRIALQQRCNLRQATTRDIEWDGEALL
jgi:hypothetical protein